MHLRGFSLQSDESEDEVALLLQDMTSLLAFLCLSFTAMRCPPFLLRCLDISSAILQAFFPMSKEVISTNCLEHFMGITMYQPFSLSPIETLYNSPRMHGSTYANLARTLRRACVLRDFLAWRHITKLKNHINVSVLIPQGQNLNSISSIPEGRTRTRLHIERKNKRHSFPPALPLHTQTRTGLTTGDVHYPP